MLGKSRFKLFGICVALFSVTAFYSLPSSALDFSKPDVALIGPTALTIFSPSAFGLDLGMIGGSVGYVNHWIGTDINDGFLVLGFGLGKGDILGLHVEILSDSVGVYDPFAKNGNLSFKLFHEFNNTTSVAIGAANGVGWGAFKPWAHSYFVVGTKIINLRSTIDNALPLTLTAGIGTGLFSSPEAFKANRETINGFASAALRVLPRASIIADWEMQQLAVGVSVIPIARFPAVLSVSMMNAAGRGHDQPKAYMATLSVGYAFM